MPNLSALVNALVRIAEAIRSLPNNAVYVGARAHLTSTISTTVNNAFTALSLTTEDYDNGNNMASGIYTCPEIAKYDIFGQVEYDGLVANKSCGVGILIDGVTLAVVSYESIGTITYQTAKVHDEMQLNAGQTIQLMYFQSTGATTPDIVPGYGHTFLRVKLVRD